jgi:hypothetical protein
LNKITGPANTNAPDGLWGQVNRALFGAIDSKITTARWMTGGFRAVLQNGPSAVQQPVFDFNEYKKMEPNAADELWFGLPTRFDFPPLLVYSAMHTEMGHDPTGLERTEHPGSRNARHHDPKFSFF